MGGQTVGESDNIMGAIDQLKKMMLMALIGDFSDRELTASDLKNGYEGPAIESLRQQLSQSPIYDKVSFDLALSQLEGSKMVRTGPQVPYENTPGSAVVIIALVNKREYASLTEKGFAEGQKPASKRRDGSQNVKIYGGTFNQSPIAVGANVSQETSFDITDDGELAKSLLALLDQRQVLHSAEPGETVSALVATAKTGDLGKAKPIFQKLFGAATETVKQIAWGLLTAYVTKQLGIG